MKIELLWKWLKYDVRQLTWRYAKARLEDKSPETADMASEDGSKTSEDMTYRLCLTGAARLGAVLKDYLDDDGVEEADDKGETYAQAWLFGLKRGADVSGAQSMASLMHWYIVRFAVWQWLKMYSPNEAGQERQELKELEDEMKTALSLGDMPMKERDGDDTGEDEVIIQYVPIDYEMRDKALPEGD